MFNAFVTLFTGMDLQTIILFILTNACFITWIFIRKVKVLPFIGIFGILITILLRLKAGYNNGNEPLLYTFWITLLVVLTYIIAHFSVKTIYEYKRNKATRVGYMHKTPIKLNEKGTPDFTEMLGKTGICKTDLKPTGKVDFGDRVLDCVSSKGYIYAGNNVKVIKIDGYKIVVAKRK